MNTLQDIMGLITKRKIKTPSDNDYIVSAAYTDTQERLKPQPKMVANLLNIGALKSYILANVPIPVTQPVSATQSGIVDNTSLQELGGVDKTINGIRIGRGNISDPASENTAAGYQALQSVIHTTGDEGYYNTAFGDSALSSLTTGDSNDAFGDWALRLCTTGTFNVAMGSVALTHLTTGTYNTAIGSGALYDLTTGFGNTAIGSNTIQSNISGVRNTAIGSAALNKNTGSNNTAIGNYAGGFATSSGNSNILIGFQAGRDVTTGSNNLLIENITNASITSGSFNIVLNPKQKSGVTTGSYNTIIGCWDGTFPTTMFNNVIIGDGQGNIRFRATETGLTTAPSQTNALITADTTGKAIITKEYLTANFYKYNFEGSLSWTGTTATVNLLTITIPANSLTDYLDIRSIMVQQSGPTLGGLTIRVWHNTVNNFTTATRIANFAYGTASSDLFAQIARRFSIQSGQLLGFSAIPSNATGEGANTNAALSIPFNTAAINYLFISVQLNNALDTATLRNVNIIV